MTESPSPSSRKINRRTFLQIVAVAGAAGACWQLGLFNGESRLAVARRSQPIMGTYVNLTVYGKDQDACEEAIDATLGKMTVLERRLSRHMSSSPVFQLNTNTSLAGPGKELLEVLHLSRTLSEKSDGAFDVTMLPLLTLYSEHKDPDTDTLNQARSVIDYRKLAFSEKEIRFSEPGMSITLDGIGKGYIVDQGVAVLKELGYHQVYLDAGGDLMVTGAKPDGSSWRIGIMNPRKESAAKPVVFNVTERAVATSGDYFQAFTPDLKNHHIIDPHTGFSSPELASCTVTAPSVVIADGLATAVMVLGRDKGLELLESMDDCEGYLIDKNQNSYHTGGFFS